MRYFQTNLRKTILTRWSVGAKETSLEIILFIGGGLVVIRLKTSKHLSRFESEQSKDSVPEIHSYNLALFLYVTLHLVHIVYQRNE